MRKKGQLPRLEPEWYRGRAFVFWTFTTEKRESGWLSDSYGSLFRELLLHTAHRYQLLVPAYCLMPDHLHWMGIGLSDSSDQRKATSFLRKFLTLRSGAAPQWQRQPHDHVLTEKERDRGAFQSTCHYILENPVRAGLVETSENWKHSGCLVPGYPSLNPHEEGYWNRFWKIYEERVCADE